MKIKILTSFLCINACLSFACFSLPVELDTWKNLHQSKEKNVNENFDDDINEIKNNYNFNLSAYLGVNEYTSIHSNTNIVHGIPLSLALGYRIKGNFRVDLEGVIQAVEFKYITNDDSKNDTEKVEIKSNTITEDIGQKVQPQQDENDSQTPSPVEGIGKEGETRSNKTTFSEIKSDSEDIKKEVDYVVEDILDKVASEQAVEPKSGTPSLRIINIGESLATLLSTMKLSVQYVISNVYYDINIGDTKFAPYISIGAGAGTLNSNFYFVMQGKLGINYQLTDRMQLSTGYRLLHALSSDGGNNFLGANNIEVGLAFNF